MLDKTDYIRRERPEFCYLFFKSSTPWNYIDDHVVYIDLDKKGKDNLSPQHKLFKQDNGQEDPESRRTSACMGGNGNRKL